MFRTRLMRVFLRSFTPLPFGRNTDEAASAGGGWVRGYINKVFSSHTFQYPDIFRWHLPRRDNVGRSSWNPSTKNISLRAWAAI